MSSRVRAATVLCCASVAMTGASVASAAQSPVVSDCNANGRLTQHYSVTQLQTALGTMPADVREYTDCYDVIQRALISQVSGGKHASASPSQSSSNSSLPTPVIVLIVIVVLAGATAAAFAVRRRQGADGDR